MFSSFFDKKNLGQPKPITFFFDYHYAPVAYWLSNSLVNINLSCEEKDSVRFRAGASCLSYNGIISGCSPGEVGPIPARQISAVSVTGCTFGFQPKRTGSSPVRRIGKLVHVGEHPPEAREREVQVFHFPLGNYGPIWDKFGISGSKLQMNTSQWLQAYPMPQ